jgi:ATP-binding cassette subfamily B protein/subfamily B ATP-binding cassette protein MsbA
MRNFFRSLKYSWPYRFRLAASVGCALLVALLWSLNLSAIYPTLKILSTDKNLQQWVDDEIDANQREIAERNEKLRALNAELAVVQANPDSVDRENVERRYTHNIAKLEGELSGYGRSVYWYQILKSQVIRLLPTDRFHTFVWIMLAVVAGVALKGVFEFLQESLVGSVTNRTLFDLRNRFFRRVIHQDVRQIADTKTPEVMARFTNDMEQLGLGIKILYGRMVAEPLKAIGCLVFACCISWQLTLVFAVLVPVAMLLLMKVSKMMRRAARKVLERMSAIYKIVKETFDSIRAVKGFTREPRERRKFRRATEEYYRKAMRVIHIDAFANPMIELLGVAAVGLALAAGTYLVVSGRTHIFGFRMSSQPLGFATLLQLYALLAAIADPIRKLSSVYTKLQGGEAAATRVFELFDQTPTVTANGDGPRIRGVHKEIEFRTVCFSYHPAADPPTLDRVSLTVRPGETIAIVGPNGCGKTTLLGLLPRFYDPDFGSVLIDGVNIRTAHLRTLRRQIGIVTQDTQLFDDTVYANIAYGRLGATKDEVLAAARRAHAHRFIEALPDGYQTRIGDMGGKLSGGQRQRIALARVILRNPQILILDEFTSQIDAESEAEIHAALREFVKGPSGMDAQPAPGAETRADPTASPVLRAVSPDGAGGVEAEAAEQTPPGRTTFIITHRVNTLEIADRIVVMDVGRVIDVGTHAELLARCELYRRLHDPGQRGLAA